MEWTRWYCDVTHLKVDWPNQITMTKLGNGRYNVYLLNLNRDVNDTVFTPIKQYTGSEDTCRGYGEKWANLLGLGGK